MSAQSSVEPGGYYTYKKQALPQFDVTDDRTVAEVVAGLKAAGREPVFKDWDDIFN